MNLEKGMKVKVRDDWRNHEDYRLSTNGVEDLCGIMSDRINTEKVSTVSGVDPDGYYCYLSDNNYTWPITALEIIEEEAL